MGGRNIYLLHCHLGKAKNHGLIKQMPFLILPGTNCVDFSCRGISSLLQLLETARSLGRAHVQVLFHPPESSSIGVVGTGHGFGLVSFRESY